MRIFALLLLITKQVATVLSAAAGGEEEEIFCPSLKGGIIKQGKMKSFCVATVDDTRLMITRDRHPKLADYTAGPALQDPFEGVTLRRGEYSDCCQLFHALHMAFYRSYPEYKYRVDREKENTLKVFIAYVREVKGGGLPGYDSASGWVH
ncbi:hypothetical protein FOZ62_031355 [Perkinsus olseni]|uniref:Uncharacterized protein n=1 Tax=Perkinsus olseni TaxID=32597 RepID=A0A7J6NCT1_PEROL|nr:hypothetical protein FOZ62_031355 [Perkinsus olseni]